MNQDLRADFHEKLMSLIRSVRYYQMSISRHTDPLQDPNRGQGRILAMLKIQDNMTSKDLGYLLGIRQQSLNESLKRLEKEGCIVRKPDPQDHRIMRIHLTEKGRQVKQNQNKNDDVLANFSDEELKRFGSYLDRLRHSYDKHIAASFDARDARRADEMQEHMKMMCQRMGSDRFNEMMGRFGQMGMPMGMHHCHLHGSCPKHHFHDFND